MDKVEEAKLKEKKTKKRKFKFLSFVLFILFLCCALTSATTGLLWYSGHLQDYTCGLVQEDSNFWNDLKCDEYKQEPVQPEGDGEFQYNVQGDKELDISDAEQIIIDVVDNTSHAVVGIGLKNENNDDKVIGTGFIITANGLVVTNQHVVSGGNPEDFFVVLQDGTQSLNVTEIYRDEINDIAIVRVEGENLPTIPLGNSDELKVGQTVIAIGNPLGSLSGTVTVGTLSGINRDVEVGNGGGFNFSSTTYSDVIQTDAAINPGNSGGPLINSSGEVIGVNFATISGADNLSFALPINRIKIRIDELNEFGSFRLPFLGVEYRNRVVFIDGEAIVGARILSLVTDGPAEDAGLLLDDVILEYDGKSVEDTSLVDLIQESEIGKEIEVIVLRDNEVMTIDVVIGNRSDFE
ncbi:trypsin-like peptidase domain-containing protein [Candidatus Dojkabacteria bacterium]|uniref:Trypsin-like peptidase domain-containing protein n=1 Tax=Candidatus Dojkabacteria bacterium TaxID=2099670 RepID=A0A955RJG0_9BACT|nr:trypsin-like peptidase domain-containing protein [Candidatus Dojkabacteria bacterium]